MTDPARPRKRRAICYWEPTYNPSLVDKMTPKPWNFVGAKGPEHGFFEGASFTESLDNGGPRKESNIIFRECDFQGFFEPQSQFVFDRCQFIGCDLALTTWKKIKFSRCRFEMSSIGQTRFEDCEFRDCEWVDTGFSPNETEFIRCLISDVEACVGSAYTNLDKELLAEKRRTPFYQVMKLQGTKSTIARMLLRNHQDVGDEDTFYRTVKVFETIQSRAKIYEAAHDLWRDDFCRKPVALTRLVFWLIETMALWLFGLLNGWGSSVARPLVLLAIISVGFAQIYKYVPTSLSSSSYQKAFDIGILAGYTNYGDETQTIALILQSLHLGVAVVLYTVFFATVASRFSRVR